MDLSYNELSNIPLSNSFAEASERLKTFILTYAKAKTKGYTKIRFADHLYQIQISEGVTIQDWLNQTTEKNLKNVLLGAFRYPFISDEDVEEEQEYNKHDFYYLDTISEVQADKVACFGLAAAHLYKTLSISLTGIPKWQQNEIKVLKIEHETLKEEESVVPNVFEIECFDKQVISDFIEESSNVELISSNKKPSEKKIHFRDDHGTDVLQDFAERIVLCEYVEEVINSLPWKSQEVNFIKKVFPNGVIYLRLFWTNEGLGMAVKTTATNLRQAEEIAKYLKDNYL